MYAKAVFDHSILGRRVAWPAVLVREARGGPHESLLMASDWGGEFARTNATKTKCIKEMGNSIFTRIYPNYGARIFQGASISRSNQSPGGQQHKGE